MKKLSKIQVAQNYAKALYEAAEIDKTLEKVFNDGKLICDTFDSVDEIYILNNPEIKFNQKSQIISAIAKRLEISKTSENLLLTLVENNRFDNIKAVFEQFYKLYYQKQGILEVSVQSVQPLNDKQHDKLLKGLEKLLKQKIIINYAINPDILGGLIVEFGTHRVDDSIKGKLNHLEQVMKGNV